ncbi:MAG TPA: F0F1 ATP synthase subunit epsilon [Actinomycetes bacterium]
MAELLNVDLVAADRQVWSGEATMVIARTTDGDIGILPGHAPVLGVLEGGAVQIRTGDERAVVAAVHGGFLSVAENRVAILAELAELAEEIDVEQERQTLARARHEDESEEDFQAAALRASVRIRAHGLVS